MTLTCRHFKLVFWRLIHCLLVMLLRITAFTNQFQEGSNFIFIDWNLHAKDFGSQVQSWLESEAIAIYTILLRWGLFGSIKFIDSFMRCFCAENVRLPLINCVENIRRTKPQILIKRFWRLYLTVAAASLPSLWNLIDN